MGPRRSGKTSIQRVVFYKMSPHETLFLESTNTLDIKFIANNELVQFQVWDFPGDFEFKDEIEFNGQTLTESQIFDNCGALVFVIDAQLVVSRRSLYAQFLNGNAYLQSRTN